MEKTDTVAIGLIVDSPWIPGYCGMSTMDYFTVPDKWWQANIKIRKDFPELLFIPDYWVEYGMAAEASGFGCKISFYEHKTPEVSHIISSVDDMEQAVRLKLPNPKTDGLMPFILNLYKNIRPRVKEIGDTIRIVAARGPLTIASHIMGVTEFLVGMKIDPDNTHKLLRLTSDMTKSWLEAQADVLKDTECIMVLDDIVGFLSVEDYHQFAHPYIKSIFSSFPICIRFYHNDTDNPVFYPYLEDLGVNIFNFTHKQDIRRVRELAGSKVCLFGNLSPLELLAQGTPKAVRTETIRLLENCREMPGIILSAGGGTSPGTPKENIRAMIDSANE